MFGRAAFEALSVQWGSTEACKGASPPLGAPVPRLHEGHLIRICGPPNLASWGFSPWRLRWWATLHAEFVRRTVGTACSNASSHLLLRVDAVRAKRTRAV